MNPEPDLHALIRQGAALTGAGDHGGALACYTRVLARAGSARQAREVATAHMLWVEAARFAGVPLRSLFPVLDAADRYLQSIGRPDWRSGLLIQRAATHRELAEWDEAITTAEEALAAHTPGAPGTTAGTLRYRLGDILLGAGRHYDAVPHFRAVLGTPEPGRYKAHVGLANCALKRHHPPTAVRHATAAVREAESLGAEALRLPLHALVEAHRAARNHEAASITATRYLELAGRLGSPYACFFALRSATDAALDRRDLPTARTLLTDLEQQATVLDDANGHTRRSAEAAKRRHRLNSCTPHSDGT
ncbi:hypothetical protein Aab01nite_70790 [Paractinoplanes abujensis]|uniref:Tetratricopeptide (TPR) repeat protein n=1 Tax=Paractinoplanes abujensis TaxID=882441 RepID=A0A7W7CWS0_9ACTN|nr:hypothetical protein [Actinoplanes abujensis]MBB4695899.1 tetratricopeptide (TPR) repeat protein [Actinoplanes abujensis]GID23489.1 hypothetical protein Aab01nite_70790 [Actinoplanes abujensis]